MTTQTTYRYAKVLYELQISDVVVSDARRIFREVPELITVFTNPVIARTQKHAVMDQIFPGEIKNFLKVVEDHGRMGIIQEIFDAYEEKRDELMGIVTAKLTYVVLPAKEQQEKMEAFVLKHFHAKSVKWDMREDPSIMGGFLLHVNGREYDYSTRGIFKQLEQKLTWR